MRVDEFTLKSNLLLINYSHACLCKGRDNCISCRPPDQANFEVGEVKKKKHVNGKRKLCKCTLGCKKKIPTNFPFLPRQVESDYLQPCVGPLFQNTGKFYQVINIFF